ncbi:MAG: hypothetical protein Kow0029_11740 [Candidatus Rifleibacteriota bacterium]
MAVSVKGIQYSYQIDFFRQVPTRLKSQVHNLPALSVQQPTPIDINSVQDSVIPDNDNRKSFAGVRAAPISDNVPQIRNVPGSSPEAAAQPEPPTKAPPSPAMIQRPDSIISLLPPENRIIGRPELTENLFAPPSFQQQNNIRTFPAVEAEDFPRADGNPIEPVKGIPKSEYIRAQRAYKPESGSYLQATGYEAPRQAGAVIATPPPAAITRPENITPVPRSRVEMSDTSVRPAFANNTPGPQKNTLNLKMEAELRNSNEEKTTPAPVQSFAEKQAQRLYEVFAASGLLLNNNRVDFYF